MVRSLARALILAGAAVFSMLSFGCGSASSGVTPSIDASAGCTPRTCAQQGVTCGPAGDGCGGLLSCGTCSAPETCGGGGTSSACGTGSTCVPKTCAGLGYNCGAAGDGCGNALQCGSCTAPQTCGGGGQASLCGGPATHSVLVQWTASTTPAVTYDIYRGVTHGGPYTEILSGITTTSATDMSVTAGTTYYYVARSQDANGQSANSNETMAVIP